MVALLDEIAPLRRPFMRGFHSFASTLAIVGPILGAGTALADPIAPGAAIGVAIVDFMYVDTSNEPADQAAAHQKRLERLMAALRRDFAADGRFRLVPCESMPCAEGGAPDGLLRAAAHAGAEILVIGGVHKLSTLVQWAKVDAIEITANRVVLDRLFTFRGDSDEAWDRAEAFISEDLRPALSTAADEGQEEKPP